MRSTAASINMRQFIEWDLLEGAYSAHECEKNLHMTHLLPFIHYDNELNLLKTSSKLNELLIVP